MKSSEKTVKRLLPVKLTDDEVLEKASELVQVDQQIDDVELEKKGAADNYKNRIGGLVSQKKELRRTVRDKAVYLEVECVYVPDWVSKSMILRRADTHEAIDVRAMTREEMQMSLDDAPNKPVSDEDGVVDTDGEPE